MEMLLDEERHALDELEIRLKKRFVIRSDPNFHMTEYQIKAG
jgi:hypothetical protein